MKVLQKLVVFLLLVCVMSSITYSQNTMTSTMKLDDFCVKVTVTTYPNDPCLLLEYEAFSCSGTAISNAANFRVESSGSAANPGTIVNTKLSVGDSGSVLVCNDCQSYVSSDIILLECILDMAGNTTEDGCIVIVDGCI